MPDSKDLINMDVKEKAVQSYAFKARHLNEEIEGNPLYEDDNKDKTRTFHIMLVLCLNLEVDPPEILPKISRCARTEAWFDPFEKSLEKALETIGNNLQKQYEFWQAKARFKQSIQPSIEDIFGLCRSMRASAKTGKVLFHYNGHGVPKPTDFGEIWVFHKSLRQYMPLHLKDLHSWIGSPVVYVFDCSNAGKIIRMMEQLAEKMANDPDNPNPSFLKNTLIFAACQESEVLPQNPELPADLFTACLTTPIKMALRWYLMQNEQMFPGYLNESMLELIGGSTNNRQSMLGEINWIFTAVTDTIAWSCLPPAVFEKLFRHDMLVSSLFRNFLLAERILYHYRVQPISFPPIPRTHNHPMWDVWDNVVDHYLSQLPDIYEKQNAEERLDTEMIPIISHSTYDNLYTSFDSDSSISSDEDEEYTYEIEGVGKENLIEKMEESKMNPENVPVDKEVKQINIKIDRLLIDKDENIPVTQPIDNSQAPQKSDTALVPGTTIKTNDFQIPTRKVIQENVQLKKKFPISLNENQNFLNGPLTDTFSFEHTEFFANYLTAFEYKLKTWNKKYRVSIELPILLQILLGQANRLRAIRILCEYMDLGSWAVMKCLSVGLFPYICRLLHTVDNEIRPYLTLIWGKILANAKTDFATHDILVEPACKYFVSTLLAPEACKTITKTLTFFVLSKILIDNPLGQKFIFEQNFMEILKKHFRCAFQDSPNEEIVRLRIWLILCLAKLWTNYDEGKLCGMKEEMNEMLLSNLTESCPEMRAAIVYALGTFIDNKDTVSVHGANSVSVEEGTCQYLLNHCLFDSSPLVRAELIVVIKHMVNLFPYKILVASDCTFNQPVDKFYEHLFPAGSNTWSTESEDPNVFLQIWLGLLVLSGDPYPKVRSMAEKIVNTINQYKVINNKPMNAEVPSLFDSGIASSSNSKEETAIPLPEEVPCQETRQSSSEDDPLFDLAEVSTDFYYWSAKYFTQPLMPLHDFSKSGLKKQIPRSLEKKPTFPKPVFKKLPDLRILSMPLKKTASVLMDASEMNKVKAESKLLQYQEKMRIEGSENWKSILGSPEVELSQMLLLPTESPPQLLKFHPYSCHLALVDKFGVCLLNWKTKEINHVFSQTVFHKKGLKGILNSEIIDDVTSLEFVNTEEDHGGLLLVGTADGEIKIWRNYMRDLGRIPELVTAWTGLQNQIKSSNLVGVVTHWSQSLGQLCLSGNVNYVRLWDSTQECRICDLKTNSESTVTSIDRSGDGNFVFAGSSDGHVKLIDTRLSPNKCVIHDEEADVGSIHKVAYSNHLDQVYSVGTSGKVNTWSIREPDLESSSCSSDCEIGSWLFSDWNGYLANARRHSFPLDTANCADFRVTSPMQNEHLSLLGYDGRLRGILATVASTGVVKSNIQCLPNNLKYRINVPSSVSIHPHEPFVAAGLASSNILLMNLRSKIPRKTFL